MCEDGYERTMLTSMSVVEGEGGGRRVERTAKPQRFSLPCFLAAAETPGLLRGFDSE